MEIISTIFLYVKGMLYMDHVTKPVPKTIFFVDI